MSTKNDLENLVKGLVCESESEAPFTVEEWQSGDPKDNTGKKPGDTCTVEEFLGPKAKAEKWHGEEEKAQVKGFKALKAYVGKNLSETTVHKIGGIEKDVYIVGKAGDGKWVAIKTKVVET